MQPDTHLRVIVLLGFLLGAISAFVLSRGVVPEEISVRMMMTGWGMAVAATLARQLLRSRSATLHSRGFLFLSAGFGLVAAFGLALVTVPSSSYIGSWGVAVGAVIFAIGILITAKDVRWK